MRDEINPGPVAITVLQTIVSDFEALAATIDRAAVTVFQDPSEADALASLLQAKAAAERGAHVARKALSRVLD